MEDSNQPFVGNNTPTRALGTMFLGRAAELADCGRHPYFRVAAGHRHLFNSMPSDDVAKKVLICWLKHIYSWQMGNIVRAGLELATAVKVASLNGQDSANIADAADCVFNSSGIMQGVISYFGSRTKWELIAEELVADGRRRWADADESVFVFPDDDDPDCEGEGPSLENVKRGAGDDAEDDDDEEPSDTVEQNPPATPADILSMFPGVKKRVKPSGN